MRHRLPEAERFLEISAATVGWRADAPFMLDVAEFHGLLSRAGQATGQEEIALLDRAVGLYGGELLPGSYDDWLLREREPLAQEYGDALERLTLRHEERRNYPAAIASAQQLLRHDPLHEATYRRLMRLHALNGARAAALRVYHSCATLLERELGVELGAATRAAYERLLRAEGSETAPRASRAGEVSLVDRRREWQVLQAAWRTVQRSGPHLVCLGGEAGIGKTRLTEEMLRAGELDFANQIILTPEQLGGLDGHAGLRLDAAPGVGNSVIFLNHRRAPTDDVRVRQALAFSFPYAAIVANTMLGRGTPAHGAVPTSVWGHNPAPARFVEDLDKAQDLLQIGVTLREEPADFSIRWEAARSAPEAALEAFLLGWAPAVVDPYSYLFNMFHTETQPLWNLGFYGDPAFDALVDDARRQSATDQAGASTKYIAAQQMLADDAAAIYALENPDLNVIAADIEGFLSNPAYPHLAYWYDLRRGK